jgi:hypothetical protein
VNPAREEDATEAQTEVAPLSPVVESLATEMQEATQRLRDQPWKLNALTHTPLLPEGAIASESPAPVD